MQCELKKNRIFALVLCVGETGADGCNRLSFTRIETQCGYGVIGSRARLRILFREEWGFEPPYPHHKLKGKS